ncbi:MAG: outer membrane beta-barrel protein [Bacteroidales bacterium]|nr:outer membrane beta-barrel protein [Bacteroidales bacterium]
MKGVLTSFLLMAFLLSGFTNARGQGTPEYLVYAGGGYSTLHYQPVAGNKSFLNGGGLVGVGFNYIINKSFAVGVGLEASFYSATTKASNSVPDGVVLSGLTCTVSYFKEQQQALFLDVPVMLQYRHSVNRHKFYVAAGVKIGVFPLLSKYSHKGAVLQIFQPESETVQESIAVSSFSDDFQMQMPVVTPSLEVGMRWRFNKNRRLYTGLYVDYGLQDIRKEKSDAPFVAYNRANPQASSIQNVVLTADKVTPFAVGAVFRFAFGPNETRGRSVSSPGITVSSRPANPSGSVSSANPTVKQPAKAKKSKKKPQ